MGAGGVSGKKKNPRALVVTGASIFFAFRPGMWAAKKRSIPGLRGERRTGRSLVLGC